MEQIRSALAAVRTATGQVRSRPRLLALPAANLLVAGLLGLATLLATGRLEWALIGAGAAGLEVPLLGTTLTAGLGAFLGVAVAYCVATTLEDDPATLREGLSVAWGVRRAALAWGLLTAAVAPVVDVVLVTALGTGAVLLFTVPWTVLTLFVVPALALDRESLAEALSANVATLRRRPVETAVALLGTALVVLPVTAVGLAGGVTTPARGAFVEAAVWAGGVGLLLAATVLLQVLVVAVGVVLYRDADPASPERSSPTPHGAAVDG